jgi:pimeloyl-[acyl-carrier protein] methyl ester esterase
MDGTGDLFAGFVDALGDAVLPLVVSYPPDRALDYAAITEFSRTRLPQDRPYVLLGESFSGPVAIALAAARPPGLLGLILCCTFARNPTPIFTMFKHVLGALPVSASTARLAAPFLVGSGSSCALRAALGQVSAAVMRVRMRAVLEVDYSAQMRAVKVPVLYLQAAQDRLVLAGSARHLAALAPHMQLSRLAGPHMLLQTQAASAAQAVARFIGTLQNS